MFSRHTGWENKGGYYMMNVTIPKLLLLTKKIVKDNHWLPSPLYITSLWRNTKLWSCISRAMQYLRSPFNMLDAVIKLYLWDHKSKLNTGWKEIEWLVNRLVEQRCENSKDSKASLSINQTHEEFSEATTMEN